VTESGSGDFHGLTECLLKNLHYDGAWTSGSKGPRAYGLVGSHLTLAQKGRVYLWGPPGVLVIRRPEGKIDVKMTWGVDVFIAEIPLPSTERKLPLYFSVAKVFGKTEQEAIQHGVNTGTDMIGFSVTIKR
jgi:hypothetical protein